MRKIDVTREMVDLAGDPIESGMPTTERCEACGGNIITGRSILTLRGVCVEALAIVDKDEKVSANQKMDRAMLAQRIYNEDEVELTAKEVSLLQRLVNRRYNNVLIVYQAHTWLEGSDEEDED